jgi:hypothetical protein
MDIVQRSQIKIQLQADIDQELSARITKHRQHVDLIKRHAARRGAMALAPQTVPLDFLVLGDSWFDYPIDDQFPNPFDHYDIIAQLQNHGTPEPNVLRFAYYGWPMTTIMGLAQQQQIIDALNDPDDWTSGKPDAILISGGGDDIVGDPFVIYLDYKYGGLSERFQGVLDSIQASYRALFQLRDNNAPGTPIIGHCYDYAIPNGKGVINLGPWLKPSLDFAGYGDPAEARGIVKTAIDRFHDMMQQLASDPHNNFTLVDTRGTIKPSDGWANEIHPYTQGFIDLATKKFIPALNELFPGRISASTS